MSTAALKKQIDDLSERLRALVRQREGLDRQIEATKTRLEHFREAYELVGGQIAADKATAANGGGIHHQLAAASIGRQLSKGEAWAAALKVMQAKGGQFTTDEILARADLEGGAIPRHSARGRLAELVAKGSLRRLREGVFEFPKGEART